MMVTCCADGFDKSITTDGKAWCPELVGGLGRKDKDWGDIASTCVLLVRDSGDGGRAIEVGLSSEPCNGGAYMSIVETEASGSSSDGSICMSSNSTSPVPASQELPFCTFLANSLRMKSEVNSACVSSSPPSENASSTEKELDLWRDRPLPVIVSKLTSSKEDLRPFISRFNNAHEGGRLR